MSESEKKQGTEDLNVSLVEHKALSDLIDELNVSLEKVIRESISVAIGETLLILRDQGILKSS